LVFVFRGTFPSSREKPFLPPPQKSTPLPSLSFWTTFSPSNNRSHGGLPLRALPLSLPAGGSFPSPISHGLRLPHPSCFPPPSAPPPSSSAPPRLFLAFFFRAALLAHCFSAAGPRFGFRNFFFAGFRSPFGGWSGTRPCDSFPFFPEPLTRIPTVPLWSSGPPSVPRSLFLWRFSGLG